jgi:predicted transcriptional regulator
MTFCITIISVCKFEYSTKKQIAKLTSVHHLVVDSVRRKYYKPSVNVSGVILIVHMVFYCQDYFLLEQKIKLYCTTYYNHQQSIAKQYKHKLQQRNKKKKKNEFGFLQTLKNNSTFIYFHSNSTSS